MAENKKLGMMIVLAILLSSTFALATIEYTQTTLHFNVPSIVAFTVTVLGESATTSDATAANAATNDIEFNTTDGDDAIVEAHVVGGSSETQADGTPIFQVDNIGTTNLNMSMYMNATLPACINLTWGDTWAARVDGLVADDSAVNQVTIDTSLTPGEAAKDVYLTAGFKGCSTTDSVRKMLQIAGDTTGA